MSDCCSKNKDIEDKEINFSNRDGLICYCFNKSKKELFEATKNGNENQFIDDIKSKMKDPGCFCETANPSGKCCLNDVKAFVQAMK